MTQRIIRNMNFSQHGIRSRRTALYRYNMNSKPVERAITLEQGSGSRRASP